MIFRRNLGKLQRAESLSYSSSSTTRKQPNAHQLFATSRGCHQDKSEFFAGVSSDILINSIVFIAFMKPASSAADLRDVDFHSPNFLLYFKQLVIHSPFEVHLCSYSEFLHMFAKFPIIVADMWN